MPIIKILLAFVTAFFLFILVLGVDNWPMYLIGVGIGAGIGMIDNPK